jgi:hypothetical protein
LFIAKQTPKNVKRMPIKTNRIDDIDGGFAVLTCECFL